MGPNDDFKLGYRTPAEAEPWKQADDLGRLAGMRPAYGERAASRPRWKREIAAAIEEAEQAPCPNPD